MEDVMEDTRNRVYHKNCRIVIEEQVIRSNYKSIKKLTKKRIIAVIKENGYGLGLYNMYTILYKLGIDFFAVCNYEEAIAVRSFGWEGDLLLLAPELSLERCEELVREDIIFMLGSKQQADILLQAKNQCEITPRVHLKIDVGLGRYGFYYTRLEEIKKYAPLFRLEGCYTHFASHGRFASFRIKRQMRRFHYAIRQLEEWKIPRGMIHAASSKVLATIGDFGLDAVRIGSLFLGRAALGRNASLFQDAVYLESKVYMQYKKKKGERIGYGRGIKLKRDQRVGLLRVGHGDGILLSYQDYQPIISTTFFKNLLLHRKNAHFVVIDKKKYQILGKMGASHMIIELSNENKESNVPVKIKINPLLVNPLIPRIIR